MHQITWKQRGRALGDICGSAACHKLRRHRDRMRTLMRATNLDWHNARQFIRTIHETNERLVAAFGPEAAKRIILDE